jgi:hypothetical protein
VSANDLSAQQLRRAERYLIREGHRVGIDVASRIGRCSGAPEDLACYHERDLRARLMRAQEVPPRPWNVGYHTVYNGPAVLCAACGRRAAWFEIGGRDPDDDPNERWFLDDRVIPLCGWCQVGGPIHDDEDLKRELADARRASLSWRWRWPVRT